MVPSAGMDMDRVKAAGAGVALRPGCHAALARAMQLRVPVHIMSVNWSASFVASALGLPARMASG